MLKIKILTIILLLTGCTIEMMPRHFEDDLYSKNSALVEKFSPDNILAFKKPTSPESIVPEEINYEQLGLITRKAKYTWVILSAPWCPDCYAELTSNIKKIDDFRKDSINMVLIYTNYDINNIRKQLFRAQYENRVYILSAKDYSSNESDKINKFTNQVLAHSEKLKKIINPGSVPQNFFISSGKLMKYKSGGRIDADSVIYYFK